MATKPVSVREIAELLAMQSSEMTYYLDRETGEVELVTEEIVDQAESDEPSSEVPVWAREEVEIARRILRNEGGRYVSLPTEFDVHEWAIMERFALSYPDDRISDALYQAMHGRGAFRLFKAALRRFNITDDWYAFEAEVLMGMAAGWCEANDIPCVKD